MTSQNDRAFAERRAHIDRVQAELELNQDYVLKTVRALNKHIDEAANAARETEPLPASLVFQAMLATAALLGAGAALAKVLWL